MFEFLPYSYMHGGNDSRIMPFSAFVLRLAEPTQLDSTKEGAYIVEDHNRKIGPPLVAIASQTRPAHPGRACIASEGSGDPQCYPLLFGLL